MTERVVALVLLALSAAYAVHALSYPLGSADRPGTGLFPFAVGLFGALVALGWTVAAVRRPAAAGGPGAAAEPGSLGRVATTAGLLTAFCFLLPRAGYPVMAFVFVAVLLRRLGLPWALAAGVGLASALGSWYLFAGLLAVPLPAGAWLD
jgi:hypothetical protein